MKAKFSPSLAGRQLEQAQFHVGYGNLARTGCQRERDNAYMELTPPGVFIKTDKGEYLVPYSNVVWTKLVPEKEI